jgi:hypothetical protein
MTPTPTPSEGSEGVKPERGELRVFHGNLCRYVGQAVDGNGIWEIIGDDPTLAQADPTGLSLSGRG